MKPLVAIDPFGIEITRMVLTAQIEKMGIMRDRLLSLSRQQLFTPEQQVTLVQRAEEVSGMIEEAVADLEMIR